MSNPYFSSNPVFAEKSKIDRTPNGYPTMPGYAPGHVATPPQGEGAYPPPAYGEAQGAYPPPAYGEAQGAYPPPAYGQGQWAPQPMSAEDLQRSYEQPAAGPMQTGRMTLDDAIMKSGIVVGTIVLVAAIHGLVLGPSMMLTFGGLAVGFVLGLVNSFKREPSPVLIMAYAVAEGLFLGGISAVFEGQWNGIVLQAVLATTVTFVVCLALFASGKVQVTAKSMRIWMFAMLGYLAFSLVNVVLMFAGVTTDPWGLRGATIMGIPLGIIVGVFAVLLAAYSLVIDFDSIKRGVERGVPQKYSWAAGFGIAVTLVWLYLEFLRLLAILRNN